MSLPAFDYVSPATLREVVEALAAHNGAEVIAGGTGLLPTMRQRLTAMDYVVSLKNVPELKSIELDASGALRIGAGTILESIAESALVRLKAPALAQAAKRAASPQIRSVATIGGNLCLDTRCWYTNQSEFWRSARPQCFKTGGERCHAMPRSESCVALVAGDSVPALAALDAFVDVVGTDGIRSILVRDLYTGVGTEPTVLSASDVLSAVVVPEASPKAGSAYARYSTRESIDYPLLGVAAFVAVDDAGCCRESRICVGSCAPAPYRCLEAEEVLVGSHPSHEVVESVVEKARGEVRPIVGLYASASYKRHMLGVLVRKAVWDACRSVCGEPEEER